MGSGLLFLVWPILLWPVDLLLRVEVDPLHRVRGVDVLLVRHLFQGRLVFLAWIAHGGAVPNPAEGMCHPGDGYPDAMADRDRSVVTVLLAGSVNLGIGTAKLVGGLISGSSAMLAEAAHSAADTVNEALLLMALRRSDRSPDADHPFGYGMERYFWSLLAAVSVFVLGAGFSIYQGVASLVAPAPRGDLTVSFVVLAAALVLEGSSFVRAVWQVHIEARENARSAGDQLHRAEPTVRAVVFEDGAAVAGLCLAATGLFLDHLFQTRVYDALASLAIGVLLVWVARVLGRRNRDMLLGRAVDDEVLAGIRGEIEHRPGVDEVLELLTMRLGPGEVLVAARVDVATDVNGDDLEVMADEVDAAVRASYPEVKHVFLDPTPSSQGGMDADPTGYCDG